MSLGAFYHTASDIYICYLSSIETAFIILIFARLFLADARYVIIDGQCAISTFIKSFKASYNYYDRLRMGDIVTMAHQNTLIIYYFTGSPAVSQRHVRGLAMRILCDSFIMRRSMCIVDMATRQKRIC